MRILFITILLCTFCESGTITVDPGGDGDYTEIQSALDAAADGDTVIVRAGLYLVSSSIDFNRLHDPGDPGSPPLKNLVVRAEDGPETTIIERASDFSGQLDPALVFDKGEDRTSIFEGFTIRDGAEQVSRQDAIIIDSSSPTLNNCIITESASGGMGIYRSAAELNDCVVIGNSWHGVDTGYSPDEGILSFNNCTIQRNGTYGLDILYCDVILTNCTIAESVTSGIRIERSSPRLIGCRIWGNLARGVSSRLDFVRAGSAFMDNCEIFGNGLQGINLDGKGAITNCLIYGNGAAGIHGSQWCEVTVSNCTIFANGGPGVEETSSSDLALVGSIVWGNAGGGFSNEDGRHIPVSFSLVQDELGWVGTDNIIADPQLVDLGEIDLTRKRTGHIRDFEYEIPDYVVRAPDLQLFRSSPAIDSNGTWPVIDTDFDGNERPCWDGHDMGAYEYCGEEPPSPLPQFSRGDANADGILNIADAIFILAYVFSSGPDPSCISSADGNDDGKIDVADGVSILGYLFSGENELPPPFLRCGPDPTEDGLGCNEFGPCMSP